MYTNMNIQSKNWYVWMFFFTYYWECNVYIFELFLRQELVMMAILIRIGEPTFKYPFPTNYNTIVSTKKGGAVISLAEVTSWKSNNIFGVIYERERESFQAFMDK